MYRIGDKQGINYLENYYANYDGGKHNGPR